VKEIKDKEIEFKDKEIQFSNRYAALDTAFKLSEHERMFARGLVNSRGVFEWALKIMYLELFPSKKFNASTAALEVAKCLVTRSTPSALIENSDASRLYQILLSCHISSEQALKDLYSTLSTDIHGLPYSGPAVTVYSSFMSEEHKCVITRIAAEVLHFETTIDKTTDRSTIPTFSNYYPNNNDDNDNDNYSGGGENAESQAEGAIN
jgi:hypothetical protein